jgi:hypothetical protein
MTKHSRVVDHPDRGRIEYDLGRGTPVRALSRKYGLSIHSLYRFRAKMPPQLRAKHMGARLKAGADLERLRLDESENILQNLALQRARLLLSQDRALEVGYGREVTYIAGEIHRNIKLVGQYLGEFAQHQIKTSVSVLISEEYLQMRTDLMRVLAKYPDARREVAAALHAREALAAEQPAKAAPPIIDGAAQEVAVNA